MTAAILISFSLIVPPCVYGSTAPHNARFTIVRGEAAGREFFEEVIRDSKTWYPAGDRRRKQALRRRQRRRTPAPPEGVAEGVIALAVAHYQTRKPRRRRHLDLDVTPLPVGHKIRRRVADRVLAAQFQRDLFERLAHLFGVTRKVRLPA